MGSSSMSCGSTAARMLIGLPRRPLSNALALKRPMYVMPSEKLRRRYSQFNQLLTYECFREQQQDLSKSQQNNSDPSFKPGDPSFLIMSGDAIIFEKSSQVDALSVIVGRGQFLLFLPNSIDINSEPTTQILFQHPSIHINLQLFHVANIYPNNK